MEIDNISPINPIYTPPISEPAVENTESTPEMPVVSSTPSYPAVPDENIGMYVNLLI